MKRALGILLLSVALGGCGGGGGGDEGAVDAAAIKDLDEVSSPGELHACTLLTTDEIEAQLTASATQDLGGYQVTGDETSEPEHSVCTYQWSSDAGPGGNPGEEGRFTVELRPADVLELTRGEFDEEPIPGVGDEAFFRSEVPYAIVDDLAVSITNFQRGQDAQVALLRIAARRL